MKLKSKEKEKIDNDARRKIGKEFGFRQSSYINWKVKDGYFFYFVHGTFTKDADLRVKPLYYDDVFWTVFDMESNAKQPMSLRGVGAFTAPDFRIEDNKVPLEKDEDFTPENCERVWREVYAKVESQIAEFLMKNPDVETFTFVNNECLVHGHIENPLALMMEQIHHGQYAETLSYVNALLATGNRGSYAKADGTGKKPTKYINEYIRDYCLEKLTPSK